MSTTTSNSNARRSQSFNHKSSNKPTHIQNRSFSMSNAINFDSEEGLPQWRRDGSVKNCTLCVRTFSSFRRRHHCRLCGDVFCYKCCSKYRRTPYYLSPLGGVTSNSLLESRRLCNTCCRRFDDELCADPEAVVRPKSVPSTPGNATTGKKEVFNTQRNNSSGTGTAMNISNTNMNTKRETDMDSYNNVGLEDGSFRGIKSETEIGDLFGANRQQQQQLIQRQSVVMVSKSKRKERASRIWKHCS